MSRRALQRARLAVASLAVLAGCAARAPAPEAPKATDAELEQELDALGDELMTDLISLRSRLKDVEYALTTRASRHCGHLSRPRVGAIFVGAAAFPSEPLNALAPQPMGFADAPAVVYVVPGGAADRAGLRPGDVLVSVAGKKVASTRQLARTLRHLDARASVLVEFRRDDRESRATLALAPACPIYFAAVKSPMVVPWQRNTFVMDVPVGLLRLGESDDVLAVALGHQLAHALFERREDDEAATEMRADRLGIMLAAEAGFDVRVAPAYWEQVAQEYPWLIVPYLAPPRWRQRADLARRLRARYPHPDIARRMAEIRAAVAEFAVASPSGR